MDDLNKFHGQYFKGKPYTYAIVASDKNVTMDQMKKLGDVKVLTLEEIFGY